MEAQGGMSGQPLAAMTAMFEQCPKACETELDTMKKAGQCTSGRKRRACAQQANATQVRLKVAAYPASFQFTYANAATSNTFQYSRTAVASRLKSKRDGSVSDPSHVMQFVPAVEDKYSCRDSKAEVLPAAEKTNFYVLVETESVVAIDVMVTVMQTKCQFLERNGTTWGTAGCSVSPLSEMGNLKCSCDHLTSFGAQVENSPVEPNLVRLRVITASKSLITSLPFF